jgi:protein ImuB
MPLAEAKSLVRSLTIAPYEPGADCQTLLKLAEACERFSPCVAIEEGDEPESLLLDISNLAHLLGSDAELAGNVEKFFTDRRYRAEIAVADTVGLAWAVAHCIPMFQPPLRSPVIVEERGTRSEQRDGRVACSRAAQRSVSMSVSHMPTPLRGEGMPPTVSELLTQLPVEALRIADDTADLLRQLGITTVGQLLPLPRESLSSRFGGQLLRRLDQLTGVAPEVLVPHRSPAALEVGCALEHPTADRMLLTQVLAQLVEQLARQLAVRDQGAVLLVCVLKCAGGRAVPLRIGLVEPSASARQLMELVDLHLETLTLADEIVHVEIRAAVVSRLGERQGELFADRWPTDPHQLAALVNRLSSRLGYEQVVRPELRASPLPERAVRYTSNLGGMLSRSAAEREHVGISHAHATSRRGHATRPLLLYPDPQPIEVICVAPDGPPQFVWLEARRERIAQHWGPERIETLWWRGPSVRRDYYRVATEAGSQYWIFRRLADGQWFLHGIFA